MGKPSSLLWLTLFFLLLLPTAAGRILLDLAGGVMLILLGLPLLLAGFGWIGWRILQSKMVTCQACGVTTFRNSDKCPICGSAVLEVSKPPKKASNQSIPASSVTIDISAEDAGKDID
ncbi:hypothetical protein [Prochlorococcus sp. MIT 1300]|uniref:hypothetical protein n=1 Tax=Prochlorococcus sp. MIT 1300 TaxID=3096218 RepID=UPI002A75285D|nr:hypothetical protein [Prochlorococcus sp. MIT 1300]